MKRLTLLFLPVYLVLSGCTTFDPTPRVLLDSSIVQKTQVFEEFVSGYVKRIQVGDYHSSSGDEIAILGQCDVWLLAASNYELLQHFATGGGLSPQLIDVQGDGELSVMRGGGGFGGVGLLTLEGESHWGFRPNSNLAPQKMIAADLNADGALEFYVLDWDALYQLDSKGNVTWKVVGHEYRDIGLVLEDQLMCLKEGGVLERYDFNGEVLSRLELPVEPYHFDTVQWPDDFSFLVGYFGRCVLIIDSNGEVVFEGPLDGFPLYHPPQALSVRFIEGEPPYLVVLAHSRSSVGRTLLAIFTPSGEMLYQEILGGTRGMCVNVNAATGGEVLLVGDGTTGVLEYQLNSRSTRN
ncbi:MULTISPECIES: hypothetical protein [unclassified Lentimonas]|uniref:hypothetical protein n=1 Tax=unclassified Lentimonas TaxID=2630993 RepID=UPI0013212EC2|nr:MULTISPECIES: hypothetical protein [unclassified Lentimonas]CAA6678789.1 Unannotated [Lentimonas sp. CC4]CAA6684392.1 Unannotated [Lentimonas sp. CC6]CAA6692907.1 Unannotated [Lentimonas sp. CC19]CAA6695761.1 Unannotated [Lentimonas sp. CC10]CAA7069592.1 Unannotated [Lentimonas sp. CC11]